MATTQMGYDILRGNVAQCDLVNHQSFCGRISIIQNEAFELWVQPDRSPHQRDRMGPGLS